MGAGDEHTAARQLRLLQREYVRPTGHSRPLNGTSAARHAESSPPLNLAIIQHIGKSVAEVVAHMQEQDPDAAAPADPPAVYDWWRAGTDHLQPARQAVREAIIYRQSLEHAIAMGDTDVVCRHPCPQCGCWGVMWDGGREAAVCVNLRCTDVEGLTNAWPLARLAREHIAAQKKLNANAT